MSRDERNMTSTAVKHSKEQKPIFCSTNGVGTPFHGRKSRAALLAIISNTILVLLKMCVGFWSGSVSVLSEALHSATDLTASGIAFFSVRVSDTPPDDDHPFGHGKIESLSGLIEAMLIFSAAAYIIHEAVSKLHSHSLDSQKLNAGLAVMALSSVFNIVLSTHLAREAKATESIALKSEARHLRSDVVTSLGVFTGLALVRLTGIPWFDPLLAFLVSALILVSGFQIARDALAPLVDTRLPKEELEIIRTILEVEDRVLGYHKLRTRRSGSQRHADVHVQIDDNCTLIQAHDFTEELEDEIRGSLPSITINIHIEPFHAEIAHQIEKHGLNLPID